MPFGFGPSASNGGGGNTTPYRDIEQAPLSAAHDDDEDDGMPLPPYSDTPPSPSERHDDNGSDNNGDGTMSTPTTNGTNKRVGRNNAHKAISIQDESQFLSRRTTNDDDDDGYGEGDYYHNNNNNYNNSATPSKNKRSTKYRGGLICAYLKYFTTCQCCNERPSNLLNCCNGIPKIARILFYMVLVVIIMLCAGSIGYIVAQDGSPFVPDEVSSVGTTTSFSGNDLPPPPSNLHDTCTDWITATGRKKCQLECDVAACCSLPATDSNSCWEENASYCATYRSACMALELSSSSGGGDSIGDDGGKVKLTSPHPSYLDQVCSVSSLQTPSGFDSCSAVCRPSRCCHPETYGCEVENYRFCDAYEKACVGVAESWRGSGHAVATSSSSSSGTTTNTGAIQTTANQVILKCNESNLNPPSECIEACNQGACCYISDTYPPIEQLFEKYYGGSSSTTNNNQNPFKSESSCSSNVGFCQQFGACEHLNHLKDTSGWDSDTVTYELDIASVCKAEYIAQFGALECSNVCQPAHCCFSGEYKCDDVQLGHLNCQNYNECGVLYPGFKSTEELFEMAKHIDEVCDDSFGMSPALAECKNLCKDRMCCFEDGAYGCANDSKMNCLAYAGCEIILSVKEQPKEVEKQVETPPTPAKKTEDDIDEEVDEFITALESACSATSLTTLEGIQKCHNKCQTHLCCFNNDITLVGNDCTNVHVNACNAYKPCERLVTPITQNPLIVDTNKPDLKAVAEAIEDACTLPLDTNLIDSDWITKCHGICASRMCCLVDASLGSNCEATVGKEECDAYHSCKVLLNESGNEITDANTIIEITDGKQIDFTNADIDDLCTAEVVQDPSRYEKCEERCYQRSCCFEPEPEYSCYQMEQAWCEEFKSCSVVDQIFYEHTQTFNSLCGTMSLLEQNRDTCKTQCSRYACCFRQENSCYEKNSLECDEYYMCEDFFIADEDEDGEITVTSSTTNNSGPHFTEFEASIESACSPDSLKTLEGIEICFNKCQAHLCCVPTDALEADFDCSDTYPDECNSYYVCESLVDQYSLWKPPDKSFDPYAVKLAVEEACNLPNDATQATEEQIAKCHQVCEARMCCLAHESLGSNCVETLGGDECGDYSPCQVLIGGDTRDATGIEELCDYNSVTLDEEIFRKCEKKCSERSCCFEDEAEYSCYAMEKDWCLEFERCEYVDLFLPGTEPTPAISEPTINDEEDRDEGIDFDRIDERCSEKYLLANGMEECEYLCDPFNCCFEFSDCSYPNESDCLRVNACENFYNPTQEDLIIERICSEEQLENNEEPCQTSCKPYECCFDTNMICSSSIQDECNYYEPCRNYFETYQSDVDVDKDSTGSTGTLENIPSQTTGQQNFKTLCTTSNIGENWDLCKGECSPYACCFSQTDACYLKNKQECDDHFVCEEFYEVEESSGGTEDNSGQASNSVATMESRCSAENIQRDQLDDCEGYCLSYECCFTFSNSCYVSKKQECDDNNFCQNVFDQLRNQPPSPAAANDSSPLQEGKADVSASESELLILAKACNLGQIRIDDTECRMLCQGSECCFNDVSGIVVEPCTEREQFCNDHTICASMFM